MSEIVDDPDWKSLVEAVAILDRRFSDEATGLRDPARQFELFRQNGLALGDRQLETLARLQLFHTPSGRPMPVTRARIDDPRIQARWNWNCSTRSGSPTPPR